MRSCQDFHVESVGAAVAATSVGLDEAPTGTSELEGSVVTENALLVPPAAGPQNRLHSTVWLAVITSRMGVLVDELALVPASKIVIAPPAAEGRTHPSTVKPCEPNGPPPLLAGAESTSK